MQVRAHTYKALTCQTRRPDIDRHNKKKGMADGKRKFASVAASRGENQVSRIAASQFQPSIMIKQMLLLLLLENKLVQT